MTLPDRIDPQDPMKRFKEIILELKRFVIITSGLAVVMCLMVGIGLGVVLGRTTQTTNNNAQQISTAKTTAAKARTAAAVAKTQAEETKTQAQRASEDVVKIVTCAQDSVNVGDCLGQKGATGAQGRQGKEGRRGVAGRPGAKGEKGDPGEDGRAPTAAEIEQAVTAYCETHGGCVGPPGSNTAVSPEQVADAVKAYCDSRGQCKGADGERGPSGETVTGPAGPPGAPGADAPPPTQEQVNAGVAAFCSANPAACQAPVAPAPPATGGTP
jgi:hypothetical protein